MYLYMYYNTKVFAHTSEYLDSELQARAEVDGDDKLIS